MSSQELQEERQTVALEISGGYVVVEDASSVVEGTSVEFVGSRLVVVTSKLPDIVFVGNSIDVLVVEDCCRSVDAAGCDELLENTGASSE